MGLPQTQDPPHVISLTYFRSTKYQYILLTGEARETNLLPILLPVSVMVVFLILVSTLVWFFYLDIQLFYHDRIAKRLSIGKCIFITFITSFISLVCLLKLNKGMYIYSLDVLVVTSIFKLFTFWHDLENNTNSKCLCTID